MGAQLTARSASLQWAARSSRLRTFPAPDRGESIDELDAARGLVAGDEPLRALAQLVGCRLGTGLQHHHGVDTLTPLGVRDTDHGGHGHRGCQPSACSTSTEYTFSPPETIMSLRRSTMKT